MIFSRTLIISAFAALVSSQALPTTISPAQETKAIKDLSAYLTSLTAQPAYTAAAAAFASAVPSDVQSEIENDPDAYLQSVLTETALPSWFSALPTSALAYFSSVGQAEISIISKDAKGPAPTNAAKVAGAVMAAGGAVMALL
ncbi:hypothetical protein JMJ35_003040 [Cladonia borealis]|uniref:Uncharacterized protein n=1 Tax=Cladonia borealis TaxID=184061 RepID=A0AA39V3B2_9LECA|nr:hypothetical protein JMJ35_003040 [Cladonia borealis]